MTASVKLATLDAERLAAKARLESTFTLLKARSAPSAIAARAMDDAKAKATASSQRAADVARDNPVALGGVAVMVASFLALSAGWKRRKRHQALATSPAAETLADPRRDAGRVAI